MSEEKQSGYKRLLKDKGSRKLLLFTGVAIVGAIVYVTAFSGGSEVVDRSRIPSAPGGAERETAIDLAPNYERELREADRQRLDQAKAANESAMATPIFGGTDSRSPFFIEDTEPEEKVDARPELPAAGAVEPIMLPKPAPPVPRPPVRQPPPREDVAQTSRPDTQQSNEPPPPPPPPYNPEERERLLGYMQGLMGADMRRTYGSFASQQFWTGPVKSTASSPNFGEGDSSLTMRDGVGYTEAAYGAGTEADPILDRLPLPGEILYAEMVSRANSDSPGPVIARVLEGPFTGATVIGTFSVAQEALVIRFNSMTIRETLDGEVINRNVPINSVAVDTEHIGTGLATDVDRHLFERIALSFATSFISGMGNAIANSGTTTISRSDGSSYTQNDTLNTREQVFVGAGEAAHEVGSILNEYYGNRPTTVIVESGTPIGLLFL